MEWLKDLRKEELPENYQDLLRLLTEGDEALKIGVTVPDLVRALQVVIALATYYNKQPFYFSGLDAIIARRKREYIIKNRGRVRVSDLARYTGLSQQSVYDIFEELQKSKQRDLFTAEDTEEGKARRAI
jgi:Mor family transcriptional regulator